MDLFSDTQGLAGGTDTQCNGGWQLAVDDGQRFTILVYEFFGWRRFANRREMGALAGLTPTPYQSGESNHEQGISKAGNVRVRGIMTELAWSWLCFRPKSRLSQWYHIRASRGQPLFMVFQGFAWSAFVFGF
jgi:transposase